MLIGWNFQWAPSLSEFRCARNSQIQLSHAYDGTNQGSLLADLDQQRPRPRNMFATIQCVNYAHKTDRQIRLMAISPTQPFVCHQIITISSFSSNLMEFMFVISYVQLMFFVVGVADPRVQTNGRWCSVSNASTLETFKISNQIRSTSNISHEIIKCLIKLECGIPFSNLDRIYVYHCSKIETLTDHQDS